VPVNGIAHGTLVPISDDKDKDAVSESPGCSAAARRA
jgi:hypothetical protein